MSWQGDSADGAISLVPPDRGGVLTLSSFWIDDDGDSRPVEQFVDLERLFPKRRKVHALRPLDVGDRSVGFEGEALIGPRQSWWKRLFHKRAWRRWRIWCVRQGPVHLLALFLQTGPVDRELETIAGMIVNTLTFAPTPAMPPDRFADRVLRLAKQKFPLLECGNEPDFQLRLGESRVNLFNFYRSYLNSPEQFEAILLPALTTVVQVQEWGRDQMQPDLATVRDRIMPMLYPESVWQEKFPQFVGTSWVADLVILYVVDETQAYWYIRDELLTHWNITAEELHELALSNLDRYFENRPMEFTVAGSEAGPRLLIPARADSYNAARLVSERFHQRVTEVLGREFAVGVPSRDFLVAISLESDEAVAHVRQRVEDDYRQMDHPLSDKLMLVTRDGVTEYVPWDDPAPTDE